MLVPIKRTASPFALAGRRLAALLAAFAVTFVISAATLVEVALDAAGQSAEALHEQRLVTHYERRLREMRFRLDEVTTRQAAAQSKLARQAAELSARSSWLRSFDAAGDGPAGTGLRLRDDDAATQDVLASVEESLRQAERRQLGDIEKIGKRLAHRTKRLAKVLRLHGIEAEATGGPLIALKGSKGFDEKVAAFEATQARFDIMRARAERLPQGSPVPGRKISSRFGARRDPLNGRQAMHAGLDFSAPRGHPVVATAAGTVRFAGRRGGYGKLVILDHGNGITTRYGHLSKITVAKGERVGRGGRIGRVGSTGRSTGPHLHYEVRRKGQARDPAHYVRLRRKLKSLM